MTAPKITSAAVQAPYVVRLTFADGQVRDVDIEPLLDLPVFRPLRDPEVFAQVKLDNGWNTIVWPGDVDLDPEVMYGIEKPAKPPHPIIRHVQRA